MTEDVTSLPAGSPSLRRALIANFGGIGNGFMILPVLGALERIAPWLSYYHVENPVFRESGFVSAVGIRRLQGEVPSLWRRFADHDRPAIDHFIAERGIDLVVNLRNEDLRSDARWQAFRDDHRSSVECWDVSEVMEPAAPRHVVEEIERLFHRHGLAVAGYRGDYLREHYRRAPGDGRLSIGLASGSQKDVKCWPDAGWISLGQQLLAHDHVDLEIYAGPSPEDRARALRVAHALVELAGPARVVLHTDLSLDELASRIGSLSLLVANDSGSVHLAAALDVPCVGLYFSTDARIWGGRSPDFVGVQSEFFFGCPERKPTAGNCQRYDSGCPAPCKQEVTSTRVAAVVTDLLARARTSRSPGVLDA